MKIAARFLSIVVFLFTLLILTLTRPTYAQQPDPPTPAPCQNPKTTPLLTDNFITDFSKDPEEGAPIFVEIQTKSGRSGDSVPVGPFSFPFEVDFSKLSALFGVSNSNYLEGNFQSESHRQENLLGLQSTKFNQFHGPGQKATPKVIVDPLKKNYVEYVYKKPTLAESANKYTDINGQNPKNIYEMVNTPDFAYPPQPPSLGGDPDIWNKTWGLYWEKIPTAYSEFYQGEIDFRWVLGQRMLEEQKQIEGCPPILPVQISFVLPEFWRTTAVSDQLNLTLVPKIAQSYQDHGILSQIFKNPSKTTNNENFLTKVATYCWKLLTEPAQKFTKDLQKIIKISLDLLNPIKPTYAQNTPEDKWCLTTIKSGKPGEAPYCPLPLAEYARLKELGVLNFCNNSPDPNKLEVANPYVKCNFTLTWPAFSEYQLPDPILERETWQKDNCTSPNEEGLYSCRPKLRVWPNFRIPWLAEIWNNTLYSDDDEASVGSPQETGRPGVYSFFMPQAVSPIRVPSSYIEAFTKCQEGNNPDACQRLAEIAKICLSFKENPFNLFKCIRQLTPKNLPGQTQASSTNDTKQRFIGATDCAKEFVRDIALKPKALQEELGIKQQCKITP